METDPGCSNVAVMKQPSSVKLACSVTKEQGLNVRPSTSVSKKVKIKPNG